MKNYCDLDPVYSTEVNRNSPGKFSYLPKA